VLIGFVLTTILISNTTILIAELKYLELAVNNHTEHNAGDDSPPVQFVPSGGSTERPFPVSGHAQTRFPPGVGKQKWLHPPLSTVQAFETALKKQESMNMNSSFPHWQQKFVYLFSLKVSMRCNTQPDYSKYEFSKSFIATEGVTTINITVINQTEKW